MHQSQKRGGGRIRIERSPVVNHIHSKQPGTVPPSILLHSKAWEDSPHYTDLDCTELANQQTISLASNKGATTNTTASQDLYLLAWHVLYCP